ncbi:MAG: MATE family efflux transporter [Alkalispirochaeta sp.]
MIHHAIVRIITLGGPLLAGNLSTYLMKTVDLAMLGRLGTETLAAAGIATLAMGILYTLVWPVSLGVQALASRRYGRQVTEGDTPARIAETGWVLSNGALAGWITTSIALILSIGVDPVLRVLLADATLVDLAMEYVRVLRWSIPIITVGMAHRGFMSAVNRTGIVMVATVIGNVLNVALNYAFIFGNLGAPALGIAGAALGTLISEALMTLLFVAYGQIAPDLRRYRLLRFAHVRRKTILDILRVIVPPAVQNVAALSIFLTYQTLIGRLGTGYLAVTSLLFAVFRINKTLVGGFAQGASILVGNRLGAADREGARTVILAQETIALVVATVIAGVLLSVPEGVLALFSVEAALVPLGVQALFFFTAFFFIEVLGYSFEIIFSHNGWGKLVLASEFVTNIVFILGWTIVAVWVLDWGIYGAWSGFAIYQVAHATILLGGFLSGRWQQVEVEGDVQTV